MGWIRCVGCIKLQREFVARTFALITQLQYVLQQVSCSYETIPNAPKYYETHRKIGIGSNGVDWLHSLRKIPTWLCGTNFCNNCTSSPRFAPSFIQLRNDLKCIQTLWNSPKHEFSVKWGGLGAFLVTRWIGCIRWEKSRRDFVSRTFVLIAPVQYVWHQVSCKTYCRLGAFVAKNPMWLRGTNFCINCASSPCFAPSFMQLRNDPKCTQTLSNAPKHEFRVQWGGLGAFVAKKS